MNRKKKIGIPLLMIASMVLLSGFVTYWLINQFNLEKQGLYQQMNYELRTSEEDVMDAVIVDYLGPILDDSLSRKKKLFINEAGNNDHRVTSIRVDFDGHDSIHMDGDLVAIGNRDLELFGDTTFNIVSSSEQERFFLQGVKLVMKITEDSLPSGEKRIQKFMPSMDSQKLLKVFDERIQESTGKDFGVTWVADTQRQHGTLSSKGHKNLYFTSNHLVSTQVIEVEKVFPFVIAKILPQIGFAFILLILSGSAFLLAYRSLKRQTELNATRNEFIGNISHELKTPVSTVKVVLEALKNFDQIKDPKLTQEYLTMASAELDRLDNLTQKVLNQSKLESSQYFIEKENINMVSLCESVIKKWMPKIIEENGSLNFLHSHPEMELQGDPLYIEGVLVNLIDNGVKYAGPEANIVVELTEDDKEIRLSVSDRGPGIPKKYLGQVFEKFFRLPSDNKHNIKGHGLGLSFAALVMEQHNGEIKVSNHSEGGCIFELTFPKE